MQTPCNSWELQCFAGIAAILRNQIKTPSPNTQNGLRCLHEIQNSRAHAMNASDPASCWLCMQISSWCRPVQLNKDRNPSKESERVPEKGETKKNGEKTEGVVGSGLSCFSQLNLIRWKLLASSELFISPRQAIFLLIHIYPQVMIEGQELCNFHTIFCLSFACSWSFRALCPIKLLPTFGLPSWRCLSAVELVIFCNSLGLSVSKHFLPY